LNCKTTQSIEVNVYNLGCYIKSVMDQANLSDEASAFFCKAIKMTNSSLALLLLGQWLITISSYPLWTNILHVFTN